ncbi:hypothetical protein BJY04DRAFT_187194 [Aspergillus karnatakaensis]|uniref:uncharacterized protein n=1 Tax=Aspergillus karnatakaensis TaxID=1810916 RepID=UPI003CCCF8DD
MLLIHLGVALAFWAPRMTIAEECIFENGYGSFKINSTEEIRDIFNGCTTIVAQQISISSYFNGTFSFPGVTNFTGTLDCTYDGSQYGRPGVSTVEMADLQYLGGLSATHTEIAHFSFPELISVSGEIEVMSWTALFEMDFPKLRDADQIVLSRRYSKLNFESLEKVQGDLIIESCTFCGPDVRYTYDIDPMASFPVLKSAGFIRLEGIFSSISLPLLESAGPPTLRWASDSGLSIYVKQNGMELGFPQLRTVDKQFFVHGAIMGLELPVIGSINGSFRVDTDTPLSLNVPLSSATWLQLDGNIKEAKFSRLNTATTELRLDGISCGKMGEGLRESGYYEDRCGKYKKPLSKGAKIAIGVIVPIAAGLLLFFLVYYYKKRIRKKPKVTAEVEMVNMDIPASGRRREDTELGGQRSATPPPPYEAQPPRM